MCACKNRCALQACNPPTDPGRVPLSLRFLRHAPVLLVDFPAPASLRQIYGTFNRALLRLAPPLRAFSGPLTDAMVDVYRENQLRFTPDAHSHYVYSPRELSRWVRAIYEARRRVHRVHLPIYQRHVIQVLICIPRIHPYRRS